MDSRRIDDPLRIEVQRPREEVFDFLTDPRNIRPIVPNLVDEGVIEVTPGRVAMTFWHVYEENGRRMRMTGVVTEFETAKGTWSVTE